MNSFVGSIERIVNNWFLERKLKKSYFNNERLSYGLSIFLNIFYKEIQTVK